MKRGKHIAGGRFTRRDFLKISGLSAGGMALGSFTYIPMGLAKEVFPAKRITFIVPDRAGGGNDTLSRGLTLYISKYLKEVSPGATSGDIIVKNESAGSGRKGQALIFRAKPDGYTIGLTNDAVITDDIMEKSDIDFRKFTLLMVLNATGGVILSNKKGLKSWNEVLDKTKKEVITMACGQAGRTNHMAAIFMNELVGTKFKLVNFPGTAETINALLRGDVDLSMVKEDTTQGIIKSGEVNVLLLTDPDTDMSQYPGAVNLAHMGFAKAARTMNTYRYVIGPPNLEAEPRNILLAAMKKATTDKDFVAWAKKVGGKIQNIYGDEAQKTFFDTIKSYDELIPILRKHLQ